MSTFTNIIAEGSGWRLTQDKCNGILELTFDAGFKAWTDHGRSTVTIDLPDNFLEEFFKKKHLIYKELEKE